MNTKVARTLLAAISMLVIAGLACSGNVAGFQFGATATPTQTLTPTPTNTPLPTPTPTLTPTPQPTPTPVGIEGIDYPITVKGLDLLFESVTFPKSYEASWGKTYYPNPGLKFLLVKATVSSGDPSTISDKTVWTESGEDGVRVVDEYGNINFWAINGYSLVTVEWLFTVPTGSKTFSLRLPDGKKVDLSSLYP